MLNSILFHRDIYLEQIIDNMAVFEIVDYQGEINPLFVHVSEDHGLLVNYYYHAKAEVVKGELDPYLLREGDEWVYKLLDREDAEDVNKFIHLKLDAEEDKTEVIRDKMMKEAKNIRLKSAFLDEMYRNVKKSKRGLDWDAQFKDRQIKIQNEDYAKYKEAVGKEKVEVLSKDGWIKRFNSVIEDFVRGDISKEQVVEKLVYLNAGIVGVSLALNKLDGKNYIIYREVLFKLLKKMNMIELSSLKIYHGIPNADKFVRYFDYNEFMIRSIKGMYDGRWEKGEIDCLAVAKFVSEFNVTDFVWGNTY